MRYALSGIVGGALTMAAWTFGASAIICQMSGDAFVFPWTEFWPRTWWFGQNWWATTCVIVAALVPSVVAIMLWVVVFAILTGRKKRPVIYGETAFANQGQMQQGGIKTSRRLFGR